MVSAVPGSPKRIRAGRLLKLHRGATFGEVSNPSLFLQPIENTSRNQRGTALAIGRLHLGEGPDSIPSRGGAHNRADRQSDGLTRAQVRNLKAAASHADRIGLPLNRMITVHWESAGVPLLGMAKATGHFLDLLSKALSRHGARTAWIWTHENGDRKGGHCHILAHVPPNLVAVLTGLQRGWLRRITGRAYTARVIASRPVGGQLGLEAGNPPVHAANLSAALAYCLKGICFQTQAEATAILDQSGGLVIGKRCGNSQNIGPKARKTWKADQ